ncbi:Six-hairpin glycosidase-like protein [Xylariomycetidae sp. FL2044]|nr:Six-hairpin glycosidase-like protein [Xylariomycetidae sp. FL2044]
MRLRSCSGLGAVIVPISLATLFSSTVASSSSSSSSSSSPDANVHDGRYSTWMATSLMSRSQGIMTGAGGSSELLQAGFTQKALTALTSQYPGDALAPTLQAYLRASAESVAPFVLNATSDALSYPMDRLSNGNALLTLSAENGNSSLRAAADALRQSIDLNRRNAEGGLWYYVYPEWSYLDGMYSLAPYYTLYATTTAPLSSQSTADALDDMQYQLDLLWNRTYSAPTGLLKHGYDASLTAVWADPETGASPYVWGRSLGWFFMALVDTLETLPKSTCRYRSHLLGMYQDLAAAVVRAVDPATGGWWQVVDQPGRGGNYIESSGSAMFAYGLLKGARLGYAGADPATVAAATGIATRAHKYITDNFVVRETNGTISYNQTVSVCSLNSTASYEYYIGQPILYNSVLGSAAYILASLEVERLGL